MYACMGRLGGDLLGGSGCVYEWWIEVEVVRELLKIIQFPICQDAAWQSSQDTQPHSASEYFPPS